MKLYKRNAQGKPLIWSIEEVSQLVGTKINEHNIKVQYGLVGGTVHTEIIPITLKNANELQSRISAKRKEGYKELSELKDGVNPEVLRGLEIASLQYCQTPPTNNLIHFLNTYLPKYSTTSEGFVLPMLAKVLDSDKPFDKFGAMLGQWKIDGLRCIIGAEEDLQDMFNPVRLTYHSRTGEDWTSKMYWMDDIILPYLSAELVDMMVNEGACLDGELYIPGYSVNDINSFVKNDKLAQHYKLQYWCYDICIENMSAVKRNEFRLKNIKRIAYTFNTKEEHLNCGNQFVLLPTFDYIKSMDSAIYERDKFMDLGFEGLILRNPNAEYQFGKRNQAMFKFKKVDDGKFEIVNIIQEHKRSDLPLFICRNDINNQLFEVSINKPHDVQREILANKNEYIGKYMVVEFRARSGVTQVPFHARGIKII